MTTLSANKPRAYEQGNRNELLMIASDIIYEGAAVGIVSGSGHARPLAAGDKFAGFAEATADNSAGAAAAKSVRVIANGLIQLPVGSVAITDIGKAVYASDDDTFTLTATSNSYVGRVHRHVSSGVAVVAFDANPAGGSLTALTDNSGGTASDTIADVPGSYTEATLANQLASLTAKINAIIAFLK
jgi:predicted RecA/RadA family phage recombinase